MRLRAIKAGRSVWGALPLRVQIYLLTTMLAIALLPFWQAGFAPSLAAQCSIKVPQEAAPTLS